MHAMWSKRWPTQAFVCALGALCLALSATIGAAPVAHAWGPGPCAAVTSADLAQNALTSAGGVTARLSRTQGTVGTALTATGAGWPVGATVLVDIYIKRNSDVHAVGTVTQATVSANGTFTTARFLAPETVACSSLGASSDGRPTDGGSMLLLIHTRDGKARAPVTFTYLTYALGPQILPVSAVSALTPGTTLTFTGAHWEPGEQVTLTPMVAPGSFMPGPYPPPSAFQPIPGVAVSATADENGAFSAVLPALNESPGALILLIAQGTGPRYGTVSVSSFYYQALPKIFPSIHLNEIAVNPGGALTVMGDHWLPQQPIIIEYCRGENTLPGIVGLRCDPLQAEQLATVHADENGHLVAHVRLPANARLGSVTVQARIPYAQFGLAVFAQAQPLAIAPTYAQLYPRRAWLMAHALMLAGGTLILLAALLLVGIILLRRRNGGAQPAAPEA